MLPLLVNLDQQDEYIKIVIQISFNTLKDSLNHFWSKTRKNMDNNFQKNQYKLYI